MHGFNTGDSVVHRGPQGARNGVIQDIRGTFSAAGFRATFVVLIDGVREPVLVTDPAELSKV